MEGYPRTMKLTHRVYAAIAKPNGTCRLTCKSNAGSIMAERSLENERVLRDKGQLYEEAQMNTEPALNNEQEAKTKRRHCRSGSTGNSVSSGPEQQQLPLGQDKQQWSESLYKGQPAQDKASKLREVLQRLTEQQQQLLARIDQHRQQQALQPNSIRQQFCKEIDRIEQLTSRFLKR